MVRANDVANAYTARRTAMRRVSTAEKHRSTMIQRECKIMPQKQCGNPYCRSPANEIIMLYDEEIIEVCERDADRYEDMTIARGEAVFDHDAVSKSDVDIEYYK